MRHQHVEVDLDRGRAGRHADRAADLRVQLAGVPDRARRRRSSAAQRPGCHGAYVAERTSRATEQLVGESAHERERVGPAGLATAPPPAGALALAGEDDGEVQRLLGQGVEHLGELVRGRPPVDAEDRGRAPVDGERDGAGLEERDTRRAATEVAGGRLEQAGQQGRRVRRRLARQRVGQPDGVPARVVRGEPELVEGGVTDEREADDLDAARTGQGAADPPAQALAAGQAAAGRLAREDRGHLVVADDPDDLLDQVVGVGEVGSPGRRHEAGVRSSRSPTAARCADVGVVRDVDPGDPGREVERHRDRGRRRRLADQRHAGLGGAAAELDEQLDDPVRRGGGDHAGRRRARCACRPRT